MLNKIDLFPEWTTAQTTKSLQAIAQHMQSAGLSSDAMKRRLLWFPVSADNANGVDAAFRTIARELRQATKAQRPNNAGSAMDIDE